MFTIVTTHYTQTKELISLAPPQQYMEGALGDHACHIKRIMMYASFNLRISLALHARTHKNRTHIAVLRIRFTSYTTHYTHTKELISLAPPRQYMEGALGTMHAVLNES